MQKHSNPQHLQAQLEQARQRIALLEEDLQSHHDGELEFYYRSFYFWLCIQAYQELVQAVLPPGQAARIQQQAQSMGKKHYRWLLGTPMMEAWQPTPLPSD